MSDRPLNEVTKDLGKAYTKWKSGEKDKDKYRVEFFKKATNEAASKELARKTVEVPEEISTAEDAKAWLGRNHPAWTFVEFEINENEVITALLEENPEFAPFVFVNPEDKTVYTKSVSAGSPILDEEALKENDPELWKRISFTPKPQRQLKTKEEIKDEDYAAMQRYLYLGKPKAQLTAPRKAKKEEIAEALNASQ